MVLILSVVFTCYVALLLAMIRGWRRALREESRGYDGKSNHFVSVIIPARNEANNIGNLLSDLRRQQHADFEVIVVDDHSEDNTAGVVKQFIATSPNCILLSACGHGKKNSIASGVAAAKGSLIVTTDADCRVPVEWLSTLTRHFQDEKIKLVFGAVRMTNGSFFSEIQSVEFTSLIGSGLAMAALRHPLMCNGANLAFRKSVFEEQRGYDGNLHIPSGDDEFLMRKVLSAYPNGIRPVLDRRSVVTTSPCATMTEFIQQRLRWAGKWTANNSLESRIIAVFVFCFQLITLLLPAFIAIGWVDPYPGLLLIFLKAVVEFVFLKKVTLFLDLRWSWTAFISLQAIYPLYVVLIGLFSNFNSFEWKGRKLKSVADTNKLNKEVAG